MNSRFKHCMEVRTTKYVMMGHCSGVKNQQWIFNKVDDMKRWSFALLVYSENTLKQATRPMRSCIDSLYWGCQKEEKPTAMQLVLTYTEDWTWSFANSPMNSK